MFALSHCNPFCHVNKTLVKKMIGYRSFHSPDDYAYNTRKGFHPYILKGVEEVSMTVRPDASRQVSSDGTDEE